MRGLAPAADVREARRGLVAARSLQLLREIVQPAGAFTRSPGSSGPSSQRVTSPRLSQYSRAEDAAVRGSQ